MAQDDTADKITVKPIWLGGVSGCFMSEDMLAKYPAIAVLGQKFHEFQCSPYRGEWNQRLPVSAGEMQAALLEIASLIKKAQTSHEQANTDS